MRIERAIDAFLDWRQLERDATPRSVDSYRRILWKLAAEFPEARLQELTTQDLRSFLGRWRDRSASTRSNVVSVLHSFFAWAEAEDIVEHDPSRKIRRPPKRKPDLYRPSVDELVRLRAAAVPSERPAILLMEGAGLRRSEVVGCRWADLDLVRGRARVHRKGLHWQWLPLDPDVVDELRSLFHTSAGVGRSLLYRRGGTVGLAVRARSAAEGSEATGERTGVDADALAHLQTGRRSAPLSSSASPRICESLPSRERPRSHRSSGADGPLAAGHDTGLHGRSGSR